MSKAEETNKRELAIRILDKHRKKDEVRHWVTIKHALLAMDEYATEVSRERKCHSCGKPLSNECPRCERLWET